MSLSGPCLCGDSYCPYCGDPEAARFADAVDDFVNEVAETIKTDEDLTQLTKLFKTWKLWTGKED